MASSILFMSVSVDGYIADENDFLGGADGERLHEWMADGGEVMEEMANGGAVVTGRRTAELMDHWGGSLMGGVPVFVPSHRPPSPAARWGGYTNVHYVADIATAMAQAKEAAGDKHVHVQGGVTAQEALAAGVLDELQLSQVPVLFGRGRRLFDVLPGEIELEVVRVVDTASATHLRYRVKR
ncbi:MAG TPA: dihydrofolate reductase family protein [Nocardioides sp.]|uniref:dihydrofolate reductase family protein n=1 Tax=Nocardioides sp. TaxID=35761 RepID=UPI002E33AF24|nr:dihydrofolate reductase family protein [Nocardioides sp.]HEX5086318.1 dihydrofolate reductase family protein [Nocardioides sp.]